MRTVYEYSVDESENNSTHENPLPSTKICNTSHLRYTTSHRGREAGNHNGQDVETCHALLDLSSDIPSTDDVCTGGEEPGFEDTEQGAADNELPPCGDECYTTDISK